MNTAAATPIAFTKQQRAIMAALQSAPKDEWVNANDLAEALFTAQNGLTPAARLLGELGRMTEPLKEQGLAIERTPKGLRLIPLDLGAPIAAVTREPRVLRDGEIHLGKASNGDPLGIDLAKLLAGRLLIQGNSGAGKSMLLRRLFEQSFGKVQQLLIDPEGEFSTLAEIFDVAVIDAADALRIGAHALGLQMRAERFSAVLDLSDASTDDRLTLVADLSAGLIDAPREHWRPMLVSIDETQTLAPHYADGETDAETRKRAIAAIADMMGRGRKRGIGAVIATARLAETAKAVAFKTTNVIIGRTIFDRDLERAGAALGYTVGQARALRSLADGEFVCLGPALAGAHRVRFRAGDVQSRHKGDTPAIEAPPTIGAAATAKLLRTLPTADATPAAMHEPAGKRGNRRGRDWRQEEDAIIRAGYAAGLEIREIGSQLAAIGYSTSTSNISMRAHDLGLRSERSKLPWTPAEDEIVKKAYADGVRIADIPALLKAAGFDRGGRQAIQMRAINLGITLDRVNYWTPEETEIALKALNEGKPHRVVLDELRQAGYHRGDTAIFKFAKKHNIIRSAGEAWTHEEIAELKRLYAEKVPPKKIAELLGKSIGAIRTKASNLELKQRYAWSDAEWTLLRDGHAAGDSLTKITERIGRPYPNVAAAAKRIGLSFERGKA